MASLTPDERGAWRVRFSLFATIAVVGLVLDLVSKSWVFGSLGLPGEHPPYWLVENYFGFQTAVNQGALFGMGQGGSTLFVVLAGTALVAIVAWLFWGDGWREWALVLTLGLISGGIAGNMYDRMGMWHGPEPAAEHRQGVRDWILFQCPPAKIRMLNPWPNFNLADCWIVCGVGTLVMLSLFAKEPEGDKPATRDKEE